MSDILKDVKTSLRISNTAYDIEILDLIDACKSDLTLSGILSTDDTDVLIKRLINIYVKANFGYNNLDADRLQMAYDMLKNHLAMTGDYAFYQLTFTITDSVSSSGITEAKIKLWNDELNYESVKYTNESGIAIFDVKARANYKYDISAYEYTSDEHEEDDRNSVDISADTAVAVSLSGV